MHSNWYSVVHSALITCKMRWLCFQLLPLVAACMASASGSELSDRRPPSDLTATICLPFEKYENITKEECRKSQEIIRLEEQKIAAESESTLKQLLFEEQVRALIESKQGLKEICELRLQLGDKDLAETKRQLEECQRNSKNGTQQSTISPEIAGQLRHLKSGSYFFSQNMVNWFMSLKLCKQYGLELASVETKEENDELLKVLGTSGQGHLLHWLSGTDLGSEGVFFWASTGQPLNHTFQGWGRGLPDGLRDEHCAHIWGDVWNDSNCNIQMRFICEKK